MALENAGINDLKYGVLPIGTLEFETSEDPGLTSFIDPRILPILSSMDEILVWPFTLGVEKANLFEHLDTDKISLQETHVPAPKRYA